MTFFAGRVPVAGERVTVLYRGRAARRWRGWQMQRASRRKRRVGLAGTSRWLGKVLQPPARSSVDCESAAQALLAFATSRSAALRGRMRA